MSKAHCEISESDESCGQRRIEKNSWQPRRAQERAHYAKKLNVPRADPTQRKWKNQHGNTSKKAKQALEKIMHAVERV